MNLAERINAFTELGKFLSQFTQKGAQKDANVLHNDLFFDGFKHQIKLAQEHNGWFTDDNIYFALKAALKFPCPSQKSALCLPPYMSAG